MEDIVDDGRDDEPALEVGDGRPVAVFVVWIHRSSGEGLSMCVVQEKNGFFVFYCLMKRFRKRVF
ncbi:hypothetical protein J2129_000357 [Methanofollis sp. W23]|uniref:hypothetical protein n=1 Tax=Methanofollis sp. W23 TaxID=2817849 RepID=UPI001AEA212E|nr:hypothetical protein [Methanofollis sp. W23]MBP2144903.1 hypothetical protein [Methanofollis sp. W23]